MLPPMWRVDDIAEIAAAALKARADALRLEQAVRGLDSLAEVGFHPLLAAALERAGFGVSRERPYPGLPGHRPKHSERERCDLALTPSPAIAIRDPVAELKARDAAAGTLFAPLAEALAVAPGIVPDEALWLEVKLVGQFCFTAGVPGPNRAYASELLSVVRADIPKLARDRMIRHAALILILFTADRATAEHDLAAFMHRCVDRGLPVTSPSTASFDVPDLIGNTICTICVVPVRRAEDD